MDSLLRFILRLILVPLGVFFAVLVAGCVLAVAEWHAFLAYMNAHPNADQGGYILAMIFLAPVAMFIIAGAVIMVLAPAAIGILIAEFFGIRSFLFHTANGLISAWIGWSVINPPKTEQQFFSDPKIVIVMGLTAGFIYWVIAGWSSGFWKPMTKRAAPAQPPAVAPPAAPPPPPAPAQLSPPPSAPPPSQQPS